MGKTLTIYAVAQLVGIVFLMLAFKQAQQATVINIIQSSRGLMAVGVVYIMARVGFSQIEQLSRKQLTNRVLGGVLMFASLTLAIIGL